MKKLTDILKNTPVREVCGDTAAAIGGLVYDSRAVKPGDCFFAVPGTQSDGHDYIPIAVEKGAAAIVCERMPADAAEGVAYVLVGDSAGAMADMAAAFYDYPSRELKLVGITGTNGKTTTATLLYDLVRAMGYKAGLISTVVYKIDGREIEATHTRNARGASISRAASFRTSRTTTSTTTRPSPSTSGPRSSFSTGCPRGLSL